MNIVNRVPIGPKRPHEPHGPVVSRQPLPPKDAPVLEVADASPMFEVDLGLVRGKITAILREAVRVALARALEQAVKREQEKRQAKREKGK